MNETWLPVNNYEGLYEISDYGNIRRILPNNCYRYIATKIDWRGYKTAHLSNKKSQTIKIHKMVLEAFDKIRPNGMQANHKDANKLNNHISNLEWVTPSENIIHAYSLGLCTDNRGENNGQSKLTSSKVRKIKTLLDKKMKQKDIALEFRVSRSLIGLIHRKERWAHI